MKIERKILCVFDTESTESDTCFEIAASVGYFDKSFQWVELHKMNCIVLENLNVELFHNSTIDNVFSRRNLKKRHDFYNSKIKSGDILIKSYAGIQKWFDNVLNTYPNCVLYAYNISFDIKLLMPHINLYAFEHKCIWAMSSIFYTRQGYYKLAMKNPSTFLSPKHNLKTSCECVMLYLGFTEEHTHKAMDDVYDEIRILGQIKRMKKRENLTAYNWKRYQLPIVLERLGLNLGVQKNV